MFLPTIASSGSFDCQSEHMRILSHVDYSSHCRMATIPGPHLINACSTVTKHCVKGVGGNLFPSFPNSHFEDFISLGRTQWPVTCKHTPEPNFYSIFVVVFYCTGSLLLCAGFLQLLQVGAALHCGAGDSYCGGFSCCRTWAYLSHSMWDIPGSGIKPMSPALASGFLTTGQPGKSLIQTLK